MLMLSWIPLLVSLAIGIKNSITISQNEVDNLVLQLVSNNVQSLVQQSTQFILQNHDNLSGIAQNELVTDLLINLPEHPTFQPGENGPFPGTGQPPPLTGRLPLPADNPNSGGQQQSQPILVSGTNEINAYLSDIVASSQGIELISVYDLGGNEISSSLSGPVGMNFMSRPDVAIALTGTRYTERIHRGPNNIPGFFISIPVKNGTAIVGAVSARLEANFIVEELAEQLGDSGDTSNIFVVDEYGIVLVHSDTTSDWLYRSLVKLDRELATSIAKGYLIDASCPEDDQACWDAALSGYEIFSIPAAQPLGESLQAAFQNGQEGSARYCFPDYVEAALDTSCESGNWHTAAYRVVIDPYYGKPLFAIVADVSEVTYLNTVKQRTTLSILGGLGTAILLVVSSIFVARSLAQPIYRLSDVAEEIEQDEPFKEANLADLASQTDELGNLARVFSKMAVVVQERERKLKMQVQELQIKINESKRKEDVERLTNNEFFKDLQTKAKKLRQESEDTDDES